MNVRDEEIAAKLAKWPATYNNDEVRTSIARIARGDGTAIRERVMDAASSPDTIRRVFIVTSSLRRQALEECFTRIRAGHSPDPHFVQLYWLLMSYFLACAEVGAFAYIVCCE